MLRIRLRRVGKKGNPSYRIVVAESSAPRDGAYVEWIGNYDPMSDPPAVSIKTERAVAWLAHGAQPSDAVQRILDRNGILERTPIQRTAGRRPGESAAPPATVAPVATAPAVAAAAPALAATEPSAEATAGEPTAVPAVEEPAAAAPDDGPTGEASDDGPTAEAPDDKPTGEASTDEATDELPDDQDHGEDA